DRGDRGLYDHLFLDRLQRLRAAEVLCDLSVSPIPLRPAPGRGDGSPLRKRAPRRAATRPRAVRAIAGQENSLHPGTLQGKAARNLSARGETTLDFSR